MLLLPGQRQSGRVISDSFMGGALPPTYTLTRASAGTRFNSAGLLVAESSDVPRFNYVYNPATGLWELGGLFVEPSRTNICKNSQVFASGWTAENLTPTDNNAVAPDGTTTACRFAENTANNSHDLFQSSGLSTTVTSGTTVAVSAFGKKGTGSYLNLLWTGGAANNRYVTAIYDLDLGVVSQTGVGSGSGTLVGTALTPLANGWYRCVLLGSVGSNISVPVIGMAGAATGNTFNANGHATYTGASKTIFAWGTDFEVASDPSSYIATTSAGVTRAADVLTRSIANGTYTIAIERLSGITTLPGQVISTGSYTVPTDVSPVRSISYRRTG